MRAKRIFRLILLIATLAAACASTGRASAWSGCSGYVTVQWGDTLSGLASSCGTTVDAIRAANPGMGWWLYAGQVLYMPQGYSAPASYYPPQTAGRTYVVQWGDTLYSIARRYGTTVSAIQSMNGLANPNYIRAGQVLSLPCGGSVTPSDRCAGPWASSG